MVLDKMFNREKVKMLTRDEILNVNDIKIVTVPVPEWGGEVYVRGMTGSERDRFESRIVKISVTPKGKKSTKVDMVDLRAKLCSATVCDSEGKLIFTESDIRKLSKKSASALQRIFSVSQKLSGIGDDDLEDLTSGIENAPLEDSASD